MNRDELLTNLAMELKRFPDFKAGEAPDVGAPGLWNTKHEEWECFAKGDHAPICKNDWLERRVDLINEPDDADAPEGYKWKAQDGDGEWFWHEVEPHTDRGSWSMLCPNDEMQVIASYGKVPAGHEWRKTLKPVNQDMSQNEPVKSRNEPHAQDARRLDEQLNESIGYGRAAPRAGDILNAAAQHMQDRASTYDKPAGERSMVATVDAFRATTGINLTEEQGWHFMALLKLVRSQQGDLRLDSYEDGAAYFALAGEAAAKHR